jgi:hypothetical protein
MGKIHNSTVDPELLRQLKEAANHQRPVSAVFTLRGLQTNATLSPTDTKAMVKEVVDRIARRTKTSPTDLNVFPNLQSFAIDAPADFIGTLLEQPEIDSAVANSQPEDMLIRPVESSPIELDDSDSSKER